jgi:hypothetical protein
MSRHLQCSPRLSSADTGFNTLSIVNSFFCSFTRRRKDGDAGGFWSRSSGLAFEQAHMQ